MTWFWKCPAEDYLIRFCPFFLKVMMSSVPSHPVKSSGSITSMQESGYGSASQDTLEKCCSPSSDTSASAKPGSMAPTPEESTSMSSIRAQLSAKLTGQSEPAMDDKSKSPSPSPLGHDSGKRPSVESVRTEADGAPSASSISASRLSLPTPSIQVDRLASCSSMDDEEEDDDDDEHHLSSSMPARSGLTRSLSQRISMRSAMHSRVAIPAPVTKPTYQTYASRQQSTGGGDDECDGGLLVSNGDLSLCYSSGLFLSLHTLAYKALLYD